MADLNHAAEKNPLLHQDWRVWAEINYLDSATEYREYLPTASNRNPVIRAVFVPRSSRPSLRWRTWSLKVLTFLVVLLIAGTLYTVSSTFPKGLFPRRGS